MKKSLQTLAAWLCALAAAHAAPLNDTGISWSGNYPSGDTGTCSAAHPAGQDCNYGRDKGPVAKVGHSAHDVNPIIAPNPDGFDFTKIANNGTALLPAAALGPNPTDWACTRDNVTGLIWEIKTATGLRGQNHQYFWFNVFSSDSWPGTADNGTGNCDTPGRCDTDTYVADVNAATLCGANDWRMPTVRELESIVNLGRANPAIDPIFFPDTALDGYWSHSASAISGIKDYAWFVNFDSGQALSGGMRSSGLLVRLVRKAP